MTINMTHTLRTLRQSAGLTQAALAEALGISDRAVSRWENGQALPDITLLPKLSLLLHVSVDALLGVDSHRRQAAIDAALAACSDAMQHGQPEQAVAALRSALSAYPDEPELQVNLARALMALHTEAAAREALALCRAADGKPARLATQYGCKQVMALALHHLGKSEQAAQLVSDEMPSFWVCRELLYTRVAPPDKAEQQRQFNLLWLADHLYFTLREMASAAQEPATSILLLEKAVGIYREVTGESAGFYEDRICQARLKQARLHMAAGAAEAAGEALHQALDAAEAYAAHNGHYAAHWLPAAHDQPTPTHAAQALYAHCLQTMQEEAFAALPELPQLITRCQNLTNP